MQINNWSDLLKSKRLAKTPRNLNNDLVIIGTNTAGSLKKQDTWQPYAMTLSDLAAAIGGGTSLPITITPVQNIDVNGGSTPVLVSPGDTVTLSVPNIPNNLIWKSEWSSATNYVEGEAVYYIDTSVTPNVYRTYVALQNNTNQTPPTATEFDSYWAMLGTQGPTGPVNNLGTSFSSAAIGTLVTAGTTTETITKSVLIPGGSFTTNDVIKIEATFGCTLANGTPAGATMVKIRVHTLNQIAGSILMQGMGNGSTNTAFNNFKTQWTWSIENETSSTRYIINQTGVGNEFGSTAAALLSNAGESIDWSEDQYIIFTIQKSATGSGDNALINYKITKS